MASSTAPTNVTSGNGADDVADPAVRRQPAETLGPRAHQTIARIMEATRDVFLTRGYAGTTIDEIARVADVSRGSFYTYFPSKRDVLIALGDDSASKSTALIDSISDRPRTRAGMATFVSDYFDLLDVHGSFSFAWTQAAQEDEEIRVAGMKGHLAICRRFGTVLTQSAERTIDDPAVLGILASSLLERSWNYGQLYVGTIDRDAVIDEAARALFAMARIPR